MLASTSTTPDDGATRSPLLRVRPLSLAGRVVLLATDGSPAAFAGARIAQALASTRQADVRVVSVVDTRSAPIPPPLDLAIGLADAVSEPSVHATQVEAVRVSLSVAAGVSVGWPIRIALGSPASVIAREAQRLDAALIVVGLRRHGRLDRAVHDETAITVMRHALCPVLGVVPELTELPRRLLVGMDFSETSLIAAQIAPAVSGAAATMLLAHVESSSSAGATEGETLVHALGVQAAFAVVARELTQQGVAVDHVVLQHELPHSSAEVLLDYADAAGVDLIAAGSVRRSGIERWLMGSVSTAIVRDGRRSVLIVPPTEARR